MQLLKDLLWQLELNYESYLNDDITFKSYKLKNKQAINLWNLTREIKYYKNTGK